MSLNKKIVNPLKLYKDMEDFGMSGLVKRWFPTNNKSRKDRYSWSRK